MEETSVEQLTVLHVMKKFPSFLGTQRSVTSSRDPTTGPHLGPYESSSHPCALFL
jgi:hypothetical protein